MPRDKRKLPQPEGQSGVPAAAPSAAAVPPVAVAAPPVAPPAVPAGPIGDGKACRISTGNMYRVDVFLAWYNIR